MNWEFILKIAKYVGSAIVGLASATLAFLGLHKEINGPKSD